MTADVLQGDPDDPARREKVIIALKIDPHPMVEIFCQRSADTTEDEDMRRVVAFSAAGVEFFAPVRGCLERHPAVRRALLPQRALVLKLSG